VGGVQDVDVHRYVQWAVADAVAHLGDGLEDALVVDVGGGDDAKPEAVVVVEVLLAVQRTAGADVADGLGVQDALLDRPPERGAVGVLSAEIGVPRVQMGIEVQHCNRAAGTFRRGAQQRERDGVVPAEGHQFAAGGSQVQCVLLNSLDGLVDVERVDGHVAGIRHLAVLKRADIPGRVVRAKQTAGFADVVRAEPCTGTVRNPGVEGDTDHRDVRLGHLVQAGQPGIGGRSCIAGNTG
jgi:hypothetical protein